MAGFGGKFKKNVEVGPQKVKNNIENRTETVLYAKKIPFFSFNLTQFQLQFKNAEEKRILVPTPVTQPLDRSATILKIRESSWAIFSMAGFEVLKL